jgi:endonuclease III
VKVTLVIRLWLRHVCRPRLLAEDNKPTLALAFFEPQHTKQYTTMTRTTRSTALKAAVPTSKGTGEDPATQLSSPPATPMPIRISATKSSASSVVKTEDHATPISKGRKRGSKQVKQEDDGDVNDLPHNLGTALPSPGAGDDNADALESEPPKKRGRKSAKTEPEADVKVKVEDESQTKAAATPKKSPKAKKAGYGLTPGVSPYPDYMRPTPEECAEVVRLLEKVHGKVIAPKAVPPPSLDVAGCGEVPSVLDALIRTRLSANTTNKNSSTAFQGLVKRFGVIKEGVGKGSVNWDAVRRAPNQDVFKAIERGGLARIKSKSIQDILQMVYEENQTRKSELLSSSDDPAGAEDEPVAEKNAEVEKASHNIISLDHLHLLDTNDAINKMLTYPGIGPKTASCVALFCLQRPSFAVDTHVFRLCQYLGWLPKTTKKGEPKVDRNTAYSHCDVRIPDEFKYPLHQLLIKHGKTCPRCRAITGQSSADWEKGCPIEHIVKRHGAKKGGSSIKDKKKSKKAADGDDDSDTDPGLPELGDGNESELSELESEQEDWVVVKSPN